MDEALTAHQPVALATIHSGLEKVFEVSAHLAFPFTLDEVASYFLPRLNITGRQLRHLLSEESFADIPFTIHEDYLLTPATQSEALRLGREQMSAAKLNSAEMFATTLSRLVPFVRMIAVTGSVAYGSAEKWDDIDLFIVTERGRLWLTVFMALILVRVGKSLGIRASHLSSFCLSYVHDELGFAADSSRNQVNPLFARELLKAKPVVGSKQYRKLLQENEWVGRMCAIPYAEKMKELDQPLDKERIDRIRNIGWFSIVLVWAEAVIFTFLSTYLRLRAYLTNLRLKSERNYLRVFEPRINHRSCVYTSNFYRWLHTLWSE